MQKSRPNGNVIRFFQRIPPRSGYISVLSFGELRRGAKLRASKDQAGAQAISVWVDQLEREFADRVLAVDQPIARIWGELSAGRTRPVVDTLLAATAMHHRLVLVTRNVRDVEDTAAVLHNPWLEA
jgi:predicted nucleic acid-binding protein